MKQIKLFSTDNKNINRTKDLINDWIYSENVEVHSIEVINGASYCSKPGSNPDIVEIFFIVLYSKK